MKISLLMVESLHGLQGKAPMIISAQNVVLETGVAPANIRVEDGIITALEEYAPIDESEGIAVPDDLLLFPGVVDSHVHLNEPGRTHWEGFASGTRAAAAGGATTVIDMPLNSIPPTTSLEALYIKQDAAKQQTSVDVGFWGGLVPGNLNQLEGLVQEGGVFGFKAFTLDSGVDEFPPVDQETLVNGMKEIKRLGSLLIVHAEAAEELIEGLDSTKSYQEFATTRPPKAEVQAIQRVVDGVKETGCRTHILHVTSQEAVEVIAEAKAAGLPVTAETCPHYLSFDATSIPDAAPQYKCCPPIREKAQQDALWQALKDGTLDIVVSDHSPADAVEKFSSEGNLMKAWGGVAGLEVSFTAVTSQAKARGIPYEKVARWMSSGPAELVGLPQKGAIAVGKDADFVLFDPETPQTISAQNLHHKNPISAYDGLEITGQIAATILRGTIIYTREDGITENTGEFIYR